VVDRPREGVADQRLLGALAEVEVVQSLVALEVEEAVHRCLALVGVEALHCLALVEAVE
jgi:hypothetical protein